MKVRRYKRELNSIKTYYEEVDIKEDYDYGVWNNWKCMDDTAPKGTKHVFLKEFNTWGYSEDLPEAYLSCFYSIGMEEKVKKMLNPPTYNS